MAEAVAGGSQVNAWLEKYSNMADLPPDGATAEELEAVAKLQAALQEQGPLPKDWRSHFLLQYSLLRFLRASKHDVEEAVSMVLAAMKWFEEARYVDDILRKWELEDLAEHKELLDKYSPEGLFGVDKRGVPVLYMRAGLRDITGMLREVGEEVFQRRFMWNMESSLDSLHRASADAGRMLIGINVVVDLTGVCYSNVQPNVDVMSNIFQKFLKNRFPEYSKRIFIINAPWFFSVGWALISPILPETTKHKICVLGSDFIDKLQEEVDVQQIPSWAGGQSSVPWPYGEGGEVPDNTAVRDSDKTTLYVDTRETCDIELDAGKTCIWEFRVESSDVDFSVVVGDEEVIPVSRVSAEDGWQVGRYTASIRDQVKLRLVFDNSFAWFGGKTVFYKVYLEDLPAVPNEGSNEATG
eukprot:TRINITY_DN27657_c0_g1_i1.p1 TRINITY_DN27657_c0_g1~~TRINITY_DN27657_c0_g1_i1.p1  ORF type:complete len:423 (-),score=87.49 TRINITY_DN27657_c0_g1_i1:21-1253(-)